MAAKEETITFLEIAEKSLLKYPDEVIERLASPTSGIVTQCKFLPTIAEMVEFCDRQWDKIFVHIQSDRRQEIRELYGRVEKVDPETEADRQEKRKKIIAQFQELVEELKMAPDPYKKNQAPVLSKAEAKAAAEQWLDDQLRYGMPKIMFSDRLKAKIALEKAQELKDGF
jgi:hypothetical protein